MTLLKVLCTFVSMDAGGDFIAVNLSSAYKLQHFQNKWQTPYEQACWQLLLFYLINSLLGIRGVTMQHSRTCESKMFQLQRVKLVSLLFFDILQVFYNIKKAVCNIFPGNFSQTLNEHIKIQMLKCSYLSGT